MFLFLLALVPALVILLYYYYRDRHPEPWAWVACVFALGALACVPAYPLERWAQSFFPHPPASGYWLFLECLLIPGMIEEGIKLFVVFAAIWWRDDFDDPVDALIYGVAAALGFTFGEDLRYYMTHGADPTRLFSTAAHPWFSCFWAASLGWARVLPRPQGTGLLALGLTASILVHALFDFIILGADTFPAWRFLRFFLPPLMVALYWAMEKQLEALQAQEACARRTRRASKGEPAPTAGFPH